MNNSTRYPEPNGIVQPSVDSTRSEATLSAWRKAPGRFTFAALLAGLLLLFFGAPAARADQSPPGCTGSGLGILLYTDAADVHIGDTLHYSATVFNGTGTGPVVCDASSIQAWVVTPDGVTNAITLVRTMLTNGQSDFYSNCATYICRAQDIQPDQTVDATAADIGIIHQNINNSVGGGNQGVNTQVSQPCIQLAVQCAGSVGENGAITFNGTVTNCGNNTLVGVTVLNFVNGGQIPVTFITNLARGQIAPFNGSYVPLNPCINSTATLVAQGTDLYTTHPRTVTNSASTTCSEVLTPGIQVTKSCPAQPVSPGQLLIFSGSVSNTGNVTLSNVVVVNTQPVPNTPVFILTSLAPGAAANFSGFYTAPTNCSVADTLTATATTSCGVVVSNFASATCPILTTPQIAVTAVCPATQVVPGGSLTYSGTVQNTGNITLTNVVVVSSRPAANTIVFAAATLAPGASANFTGTYTVPADACSVTTTFSGTGTDPCSVSAVTNTVSTTCTVTTAPAIAVTLACPPVSASAGGLIAYTGTVSNSGNVTLNNVRVVNNQPAPNTPVIGPLTLAPNASVNFTASFMAPVGSCSVSSTVIATGSDNCTAVLVTNTASATCPLITTPSIVVTQVCPVNPAIPGGLLTYSGTVSNSGNIALTQVFVVNNQPVPNTAVIGPLRLAAGEAVNFTGSYLAPTNCSTTSTSTATGQSLCGDVVSNTMSATCPILTTPQIAVTAVCPAIPVLPGGSLTYSGTVQNTGNVTLTNVVVVSSQPAPNTTVLTVAALAPGALTNFTGTSTVPANACSVTTTFSGTGTDPCTLGAVTNTVSTTCMVTTSPGIAVTLACPAVSASTGGLITYSGTVSNMGNVTLNNVFVVNDQPVPNTPVIGPLTLAPNASANFTASFTAPSNTCTVSSTVMATGSDNCTALMVTNTASATCPLITTPGIVVTQVCPVNPTMAGGLLTYSGTVSNSGNIALAQVFVVNNQPAPNTPVIGPLRLQPGAVANFTGSYLAPTNCFSTSTSTAVGRSICGDAVSSTASTTCPIVTTPAIAVTQFCPTNSVLPGGILTYSGTVSNAGNVTLTNIVVVDDQPVSNTVILTVAALAPGATTNFTGSYQVPFDCCVVWSTVEASGQGCAGVTVTDSATRTCNVLTLPQIVVTKICAPGILRWGDLMTYSGTVSNAGNVTLIDVTVVNSQFPDSSLLGPIDLAPGETEDYTASYIVPPDFCGADTVTASGLNVCTYLPATSSVTATCPVIIPPPSITVTKNCPLLPTPRGGSYVFTGSVSNSGPITLINVFVVDDQPTNNTPVIGPITLAPGASVNFTNVTNSYIAPYCCCFILDTLTARGQDHCLGSNATDTATAVCPLLTTPGIAVVQNCPLNPIPMGSVYVFNGYVTNTGDAVLTNVFVFGPQGTNTPVLGPIELAPGESESYFGSYTVPFNTCSVSVTGFGQDICGGNVVTNTTSCPIATTPGIVITESCPPGPVSAGSVVVFGGSVSNTGNIPLANILVFSTQRSNNTPVLGPIMLAPGASAPFTGSYIATGGSNPTTNSTIVTNTSGTITTNVVNVIATNVADVITTNVAGTITTNTTSTVTTNAPTPISFGTINSVSEAVVDRFLIGSNFNGLTYAGEDHGYGATEFYSMRKDITGTNFFDTIIASTATTTDRFSATNQNFDALTYAAPDLGYGPLLFYYLRHDNTGVSIFGSITPGGIVGVTTDHFVVGRNFDGLTFTATDVGYGADLFYYVRHDATGLSTFGTINPALPGTVTDRFTIGTNVDALVFTDLTAPGYGADNFYYLRHSASGVSTFGTIFVTGLTTATVTDRFTVGTNATELTFTATDVGFGPNLFYFLRGGGLSVTTNIVTTFTTNTVTTYTTNMVTTYTTNTVTTYTTNTVTTYTTNSVVTFTPTNSVTATGMDICQDRIVAAAANCLGPIGPPQFAPVFGVPTMTNGFFSVSFSGENGISYTVQYKNALNDPAWTDLETVVGTGGNLSITDAVVAQRGSRFYRVILTP